MRPPLVDSDLLRFLGTQKRLRRKVKQREDYMDALDVATTEINQYSESLALTAPALDRDESSWLGQYNHHRVAAVLMAKGGSEMDEATALAAGERVQSQALARTARRRVRAFLRERDRQWGIVREPEDAVGTAPGAASLPSREYGMEDVVDLLLSYGLTVKDIAEILTHSPGVAMMSPQAVQGSNGESLQETMDRALVQLLSSTLGLRKYDARKVLRNCPGLLTMRGSRSAEQMVAMLERLGVSTNSIARDKNALPTLLSRSPSAIFRLVSFLASDAVRMPIDKIGPLLRRPECQELLNAVAPVPPTSDNFPEVDSPLIDGLLNDGTTDPGVVSALWGRSSQLRREVINDTYRSMSTTAWTLRHEIGTEDLGKVIAAYPSVLLLDAEKQILPAAKYLMNELGIWEDDLPRVLQLYPALLGMSVDEMEKRASYLRSLEVRQENLGSIFRSFPALLTLDVEKQMIPVVRFLRSIGIANVGRFVTRLPPVLGYSVEADLQPKWEFIQSALVDPRFELTRFPAYFSYPLDRIQTRFDYLHSVKGVPTPLMVLDQVLCFGDKDFAVKVARDNDNGDQFIAYAQERKKAMRPKRRRQSLKKENVG